jgi:biotin-(acetyl-CoA carboxylase) ligase
VDGVKLAGILVEARWRDAQLEWAAIGVGVNLQHPSGVPGAALRDGTSRVLVLSELIPAMRSAAAATGALSARELAAFAERDVARGRKCREPEPGTVIGIDARGGLIVAGAHGETVHRSGSLVFEEAT